ncbi:serine/threonine-protein kinase/endoribonuclease IRE2-like [Daphnia pulicaria]|uniref:serine/threonine-protein kinase/endoribonuclease IRE2-like n=1 Tax=Daphnia pulicaria TaxID=35523 RepID=UPI001EEC57B2|nr:serine/threonine-protein kinase/endoribonuclease IRE2-like [Daphnia pulicaria]
MEIKLNREVLLGQGGFGAVFLGTFQGREVAVKRVELIRANANEGKNLKQINHPNVVQLFHVECTDDFKHFALELCTASLDQIFLEPNDPKKYNGPKLPYHFEIFSQLASGLEHIHSRNLIHRDIKPENILISVDSTGQDVKVTMKWADFGLSRAVNERGTFTMNSGVKGTSYWYAPELLRISHNFQSQPKKMEQPRGTVKSDVFALGLVYAFLLLDGEHIYGSHINEIHENILKGSAININKLERSHYAYDLINEMLKMEPNDRMSSSNIIERLKSEKLKLADKEKVMLQLCTIRDPIFPSTDQSEKLKTLIRQGVDVNVKNSNGSNALHLLCQYNSSERLIDIIQLFIQQGIDVNGENNYENNALHLLCKFNRSERLIDVIQLLIELGIDVNGENDEGDALHLLCQFNTSERLIDAMQLLIELGINVNEKTIYENNALHLLCRFNTSERIIDAIKLLIQGGFDVDGNNVRSFLWEKANINYDKIIKLFQSLTIDFIF